MCVVLHLPPLFASSVLGEIQCRSTDPTPHHVWFHFTCEVEPAPPTATFTLTAHALSTEVTDIKISNESQELWNLQVFIYFYLRCVHVHSVHGKGWPLLLYQDP